MTEKKRVTYDYARGVMEHSSGGVILWPVDHPDSEHVSNESYILTTPVLHFDEDSATIETQNTVYVPNEILE